jgi:gliding motility-associated-like protein
MAVVRFYILLLLFSLGVSPLFAQLDTIHWMPPMHGRVDWGPQYFYLSTPEQTPFAVHIRDGSGALIQTVTISNNQPFTYSIGSSDDTYTLVQANNLHKAIQKRGLIVDGEKRFYAYFRMHAANSNHAADLTCKGRAALGKVFRIGHLLQEAETTINPRRANFIGIMATEDSTDVNFSGYDPNTDFFKGGVDVQSGSGEAIRLNKGECVVYSMYLNMNKSLQPPNGFMGSLVESSKPIVINTGSFTGASVTAQAADIGIDQIVPVENVGKEYIICKGNGSEVLERPIVVAHYDNTQIYLNGSNTPVATLNAGQWFPILTSSYSANDNLYIRSTQPVYLYQMIGGAPSGSNEFRTAGLIFVPPISCSIPNSIDKIISPNVIGNMSFTGGVMITAMKDSLVTVKIDGTPVNLGVASPVLGNPDFVTYRNITLFQQTSRVNNISVVAQGAVQVAMFGQNNAASFAAFYSGFSKTIQPKIEVTNIGDGVCPDTLVATGLFDGVQWLYEDSIVRYGKDTFLIVSAPGRYIAQGYLGVCRRSEFAADTVDVNFRSPEFPYTTQEPSCFGFTNGQIRFGTPYGGKPPYQYSIDNGQSFSRNNTYTTVKAGTYKLVVRDSLGCYNRPLQIKIGQPVAMTVKIVPITAFQDVVKVGQKVVFEGKPIRRTLTAVWTPKDSANCKNCLTHTVYPISTTKVILVVTDSAGCPAADTVTIYVEPNVFVPNVFSPNSTGGNKTFTILSKDPLPIVRMAIFDRWGEHLFKAENIETNQLEQGWDGTFKGRRVEAGVYVYYAEVEVLPGRTILLKGDITVLY